VDAIAAIAIGAWSAAAAAAVVSGSNLAGSPNSGACGSLNPGEKHDCTLASPTLPPGSEAAGGARAAIDGVIVGWRVKSGGANVHQAIGLQVVHGTEGGAAGPRETLPAAPGEYSYAARVPVSAGDEIGLDEFEVDRGGPIVLRGPPIAGAVVDVWIPPLDPGDSPALTAQHDEYELMMNATIEPDADHDGFGDETQDLCPTLAGPGACPVAAPKPAAPIQRPDTAITKGPSGEIHARNVTFAFRSDPAGATFECKFDKRAFKQCGSPRKFKHLGLGQHKFQVRALNAAGTDPIPATRSFKITN
jgi:hypothetical protein